MSEKLLLIDGHSILNRAFYGVPDLTNSKGLHTNAVYGFLNIMFKVLDEEKPDYLVVAFDLKEKTFRHHMYEAYKGTRKPMPAELHEQVPVIKDVLYAMNIKTISKAGYEADDILGTLACNAEKEGLIVSILSGDRDLLQLATENIKIRIPKTKKGVTEIEDYNHNDVVNTYGVTPKEFIDMKALMGDASDNIPGVSGIGEKTAAKIIMQFKSIENAHEHIDEVMPNKARLSFAEEYETAVLSKKLATINTEVELEDSYKTSSLLEMYNEVALSKINELEFKTIAKRFNNVGTTTKVNIDISSRVVEVKNNSKYKEMLLDIENNETIGVHIVSFENEENKQLTFDFLGDSSCTDETYIFSVSTADNIYYLDTNHITFKSINEIKDELSNFLNKKKVSLFNLKQHLKYVSINNGDILDCEVAVYLLNPLKDSYNYEDIARDYTDLEVSTKDELQGKKKINELYTEDRHNFIMLTSNYSFVALYAYQNILSALNSADMQDLYYNVELPLVYSLNSMENVGIKLNHVALKQYGDVLKENISILEKEIYDECGLVFNINSPKQLGEVLFEKMGIDGGKKTKTGYSTSADVLEKLKDKYPVVNKILEYRQLTKLKSTYADALINYVDVDGRIRGKFSQTITATGRISSFEPNLQNIPIRTKLGSMIREVFVPKEGCVFVDADYSQIELRILAHVSEDESLIEAYNSGKDIHKITASKVFKIPLDEVTKEQRSNAKAVNFGIVYGMSSFGLSQDLSISKKEAADYIEQYFNTYPKVKEYLTKQVEDAKTKGYVTTIFKRRRPVPEIKSSNFMQRSFGERIAMNSPIQGTAADIIKIAMINVDRRLLKEGLSSRIVLQVHDELLVEAYESEVAKVKQIVYEEMTNAAKLSVSLEVDVQTGYNWLEAH